MIKVILTIFVVMCLFGCSPAKETGMFPKTDSQQTLEEGLNYLAQGDVARALESFQMVTLMDPSNIQVYFILGQVYMRLGAFDSVIAAAEEILKRDPQNGAAYLLIAGSYDLMGQTEQAVEMVKIAILAYQESQDVEGLQRSLALLEQLSGGLSPEEIISMDPLF